MKKVLELLAILLVLMILWITEGIWFHGQVIRKKWKYIPLFFVWVSGGVCSVIMMMRFVERF